MATIEQILERRLLKQSIYPSRPWPMYSQQDTLDVNQYKMFRYFIKFSVNISFIPKLFLMRPLFSERLAGIIGKTLVTPIIINNQKTRRSLGPLLSSMNWDSGYFEKLCLKEDYYFYGNESILLDKDFNIIFMVGYQFNYNPTTRRFTPINLIYKINRKIFLKQDDPLNKVIIQKLIPLILNNMDIHTLSTTRREFPYIDTPSLGTGVKLELVDDLNDDFIYQSGEPENVETLNDTLNEIIRENVDFISKRDGQ